MDYYEESVLCKKMNSVGWCKKVSEEKDTNTGLILNEKTFGKVKSIP